MHSETQQEGGFTLVELLIVIIILALLAAVVLFGVSSLTGKGQDEACKTDVHNLQTAVVAHYADTGAYASSVGALLSQGYIDKLPSADHGLVVSASGDVSASGC